MNTRLTHFAAAGLVAAGVALTPALSVAAVRVCLLPGSPSAALDKAVAREAFRTAGIAATFSARGIDDGDDDGISARELGKSLERDCDVIAGFPRSSVADASDASLLFSQGYLRSGYVSVKLRDASAPATDKETVAATYASPAQLIAVQQKNVRFDLENTSELTVDAVASGRAQRAIVWYPAVVAYRRAHPRQQFHVSATVSPYASWHLVFAYAPRMAALQKRIDVALSRLQDNGRLAALTRDWNLPESAAQASAARPAYRYLDGAVAAAGIVRSGVLPVRGIAAGGRFIKVSSDAAGAAGPAGDAPSFDRAQVEHGKHLYAEACAKCHGANLEGITAPALIGPSFAPLSNSHLTIGGIYDYMATNMPADRPGKMTDEEYAALMAFLLHSNGYGSGATKLTANGAHSSTTPLNAGPNQ